MGRRKGSKNKKTIRRTSRQSTTQRKTVGLEFLGGLMIVLGFIFIVLFRFENIGSFADTINILFKGLFGISRYAISIVFIYAGIFTIASSKKVNITTEVLKGLVSMVFIAGTIYVFTSTRYDLWTNPAGFIKWAYEKGNMEINQAGLVGAIIANISYSLMGELISKIILISLSFMTALYFLKLGLRDFFAIMYNIAVVIIEFFANMFYSLFAKDEEKIKRKELKAVEKEKKAREKELAKIREQDKKLAVKGNRNYADNIKDEGDQLRVNLDNNPEMERSQNELFKKQRESTEEKNVKEVLTLDHSKHEDDMSGYVFPPINLLQDSQQLGKTISKKVVDATADKLEKTLASFGVETKVTNITKGPTVIRYELTPSPGVKVSRIVNLADDIALNLSAKSIRIEAPIPGKGTVGIEVPNETKETVYIKDIIGSKKFATSESKLVFALGKDTAGDVFLSDISKMPHVLVAGSTGSGKSVCINTILTSILYNAKPNEVKLILVDPKMVELSGYNGIPHLLIPVVTDPKKAAGALNWAVSEMEDRYSKFASKGVKDISGYNRIIEQETDGRKLPQIIIVIDELADLMMVAANDVETSICRIAQKARAAGMHLVIATQRPSVDIITGLIKANIPSRIAFTVSSQIDSRTILDMAGAEKLLGRGDMLYYPTGELKPQRIQGAFVSEKEVENVVTFIKGNSTAKYNEDIIESIEKSGKVDKDSGDETEQEVDILLEAAIDLVIDMGQASASMLQRRFNVGYARAGRMIDQMEVRGIVSGYAGSKPRQLLITKENWEEMKMGSNSVYNDVNEEE